jgi:hypothetical protein
LWWLICVRINVQRPMDVRIDCVLVSRDKDMMKKRGQPFGYPA